MTESRDELPVLIAAVALLLIAVVANVWGNFPVNDDWVYAHQAKDFAATGKAHPSPTLAAAVGQTVIGGGLIRLTGFNHNSLRALTIAVAVLLCWILNAILSTVGVSRAIRMFCLLLLVFNPISGHLAFSFMTEYYGYALAFGGALVWFRGRADAEEAQTECLISSRNAIVAALLIGLSFWIRQYCILVFPAAMAASALTEKRRLRATAMSLLLAAVTFAAVVGSYFLWTHLSGPATPITTSTDPVAKMTKFDTWSNLVKFDPIVFAVMALSSFTYMTLFLLPALAAMPLRGVLCRPRAMAALLLAGLLPAVVCGMLGQPDSDLNAMVHKTFPYLRNLIYNAGIGPLTTPDLYPSASGTHVHWDERVWRAIEILLIMSQLLWAGLPSFRQLDSKRRELAIFSVIFSIFSMLLIIQASQASVFDRYLFCLLLSGVILMGCLMEGTTLVWWRAAVVFVPIALFTIGGVHDYFAFNRARWQLAGAAQRQGVRAADISAGYEFNGWFRQELPEEKPRLPVIHQCVDIHCLNDAFVIGTTVPAGYAARDVRAARYWLGSGPGLVLSVRDDVK